MTFSFSPAFPFLRDPPSRGNSLFLRRGRDRYNGFVGFFNSPLMIALPEAVAVASRSRTYALNKRFFPPTFLAIRRCSFSQGHYRIWWFLW